MNAYLQRIIVCKKCKISQNIKIVEPVVSGRLKQNKAILNSSTAHLALKLCLHIHKYKIHYLENECVDIISKDNT